MDNRISATALAEGPDLIVSDDKKDMLALRDAEGIAIVTARQAMEFLGDA